MTTLYFVRHAEPNYKNMNDEQRELTEKGLAERFKARDFLADKGVNYVMSSPYKRSIDTVRPIADDLGQSEIETDYDFRERAVCDEWLYCFDEYARRQWEDFSYKLEGGECIGEVQARNIEAIRRTLKKHEDKTIAIGSHGTALSAIINYYTDGKWGYDDFQRIKKVMPFIAKLVFEGEKCISCEVFEEL